MGLVSIRVLDDDFSDETGNTKSSLQQSLEAEVNRNKSKLEQYRQEYLTGERQVQLNDSPLATLPQLQTVSHWMKALGFGVLAQVGLRLTRIGVVEQRVDPVQALKGRDLLVDLGAIGVPHLAVKFIQERNPTANWPSTLLGPALTGLGMYAARGGDVISGLLGSGMAFLTARWGVDPWLDGVEAAKLDLFQNRMTEEDKAKSPWESMTQTRMEELARSEISTQLLADEGWIDLAQYRMSNVSTVSESWSQTPQYNPGKSEMIFMDIQAVQAYAKSHGFIAYEVNYTSDGASFERVNFYDLRQWNQWAGSRSKLTELLEKNGRTENWSLGITPPLYRKLMGGGQVTIHEVGQRIQPPQ